MAIFSPHIILHLLYLTSSLPLFKLFAFAIDFPFDFPPFTTQRARNGTARHRKKRRRAPLASGDRAFAFVGGNKKRGNEPILQFPLFQRRLATRLRR